MHTRTFGRGLGGSPVGLGAMVMSQSHGTNPGDRNEMMSVLRFAGENGLTFLNTSGMYRSIDDEELVGAAITPIREVVTLVTGFRFDVVGGRSRRLNSRPQHARRVPGESLCRLVSAVSR